MLNAILIPQDVTRDEALFCILKSLQELDKVSNELFSTFNKRVSICKNRLHGINGRIDIISRKTKTINETDDSVVLCSSIKFPTVNRGTQPLLQRSSHLPAQNHSIDVSFRAKRVLTSANYVKDSINRKKNYIYTFVKPKFHELISERDITIRENKIIVQDTLSCELISEKKLVEEKQIGNLLSSKRDGLYHDSLLIFHELKQEKAADSIMSKPTPKSINSFEFPDFLQLPGVIKKSASSEPNFNTSRLQEGSIDVFKEESKIENLYMFTDKEKLPIHTTSIEAQIRGLPAIRQSEKVLEAKVTTPIDTTSLNPPVPPPAPPPPPPPMPLQLASPRASSSLDKGRSDLMQAIREAGGSGKMKLRHIEPNSTATKTPEKASKHVVEEATDDLITSLKNAITKRRIGISGRNDKLASLENKSRHSSSIKNVEPLSRLREVIPAPQAHSSMKLSSDDEDWR